MNSIEFGSHISSLYHRKAKSNENPISIGGFIEVAWLGF
jgi:hypothetical protein